MLRRWECEKSHYSLQMILRADCVFATFRYTASWNITYGYPTSVGNSTSCGSESSYQNCCGSGPLSYQTWIVNRTITVVEDDAGPGGIFPTLPTSVASTDLPSEPTGKALGSATPRGGVSCSRVWYFIALLLSALLLG